MDGTRPFQRAAAPSSAATVLIVPIRPLYLGRKGAAEVAAVVVAEADDAAAVDVG